MNVDSETCILNLIVLLNYHLKLVFELFIDFIRGTIYLRLMNAKKRLKISKGLSETINRRRTDNAMAKRQRGKVQTMVFKTLHTENLKIEHLQLH